MGTFQGFRYFLGIRPDPSDYPFLQRLGAALGQPTRLDLLHLTLCVVAELTERDRFIVRRIEAALAGQPLHSFAVNLSRAIAGSRGAFARTSGRQDEIQDFYRMLARRLLACGIVPLHRKSGLHPHVTLGHVAREAEVLKIALQWYPAEVLLIESEVGLGRHNVLRRWSLLPPRQPQLRFDMDLTAAAGRARRSAA